MYKLLSSYDIEREISVRFLENYGNIEDYKDLNYSKPLELLNKGILILLDIMKAHSINIDVLMDEVVFGFRSIDESDRIDDVIIFNMLSDRAEYIYDKYEVVNDQTNSPNNN